MYKVGGKVLVKETGVGIANLQVVLYDLDNILATTKDQSDSSIEIFKTEEAMPFFWQQIPGERLGSALTDSNGVFELRFEEEDFAAREPVKRPDLLLLIMAPEDAYSIVSESKTGNPKLVDPMKSTVARVLHYSYDPIINSGKNEEYIIRISQKLLDNFQIHYESSAPPVITPTVDSIATNLKQEFEFEQQIKSVFRHQTQERLKSALITKTKADNAFQNFSLSKVTPEVRANSSYLNPGEKVNEKLISLFAANLDSIPRLDTGAKRKLILHLTETQIESWGLKVSNGFVDGEISVSTIVDFIRETTGGGTLEYSRSVFEKCSIKSEAEQLFKEVLEKCNAASEHEHQIGEGNTPESASEENDIESLTSASLLNKQITRQMEHTTSPEEELKYGVERNGEIVATITKPGPADVTAYHDFHELQIAFEHIWTEAFDSSILTLAKNAYSEMVRYQNRVSGGTELPEITKVEDMQGLYEDFMALREIIESENESIISEPVPEIVRTFLLPEILDVDWANMTESEKIMLTRLAQQEKLNWEKWDRYENEVPWQKNDSRIGYADERDKYIVVRDALQLQAKIILKAALVRLQSGSPLPSPSNRPKVKISDRLGNLMKELDKRLAEPHLFDIFAPNSMNYGMMVTYRQKWVPGNYQVGDMFSTIPLAPKEVRKYSTKQTINKSRMQKELEDSQSSRSGESSSTSRADNEITKQAKDKTSFESTAKGTVNVGMFEGEFGTKFGVEAEKISSSTKKNFREAVLKAAEEYRQQRRLEVETSLTEKMETTRSGEIYNPNDEITVTYLFYELQRQYEISEKIHRLTPVILVANDVPKPNEIDEDWLIAKDWILRRVILDDSFLPALSYLTSISGDELALQVLRDNVERQVSLINEMTKQAKIKNELAINAFQELKRLMNVPVTNAADAAQLKDIAMAITFGPLSLIGSDRNDEAAEKREEIAKMAIERADKDVQEVSARLSREVIALKEAIDKYTKALQEHFDRQTAIARLRIHIKENILFYMQAIWDYEPTDQRFFRLYNLNVPWIEIKSTTATVHVNGRRVGTAGGARFAPIDTPLYEVELSIPIDLFKLTDKKLSQIADLDNLVGYKGNYMIFPVKQASYLHIYMMQDYIDPLTGGLRDPDEFSNYTNDELLEYACCLSKNAPETFIQHQEHLLELLKKRMATPRKESDLVVVPTGSAYIEALPGKHPILEDFKLTHRALDVKKVQAEVRNAELENLRLAARLLEGEREDPDIERKIVIDGASSAVVVPSED